MSDFTAKPILVCDTQPVAIEGVRGLLGRCEDLRFAGAVNTLEAALELTRGLNPAAIVIDKSFGIHAITDWLHRFAVADSKAAPVLWGMGINEAEALRFLQAGARGVLRRSSEPETLVTCLRSVTNGNTWLEDGIFAEVERSPYLRRAQLTPREVEVARLVARGLTNKQIGQALFVSERTAENHVQHILIKLGFSNRSQIAAWLVMEAPAGRE